MTIDWAPLVQMVFITMAAVVLIVGVFAVGVRAQSTADARSRAGQPAGAARLAGYACFIVAALLVVCGLYLYAT